MYINNQLTKTNLLAALKNHVRHLTDSFHQMERRLEHNLIISIPDWWKEALHI